MFRFIAIFVALLVGLFALELTKPVQEALVTPWTFLLARISATLVSFFDPGVIAYDKVLMHATSGIGVSIEAGCNGIEACIILTAAILAYPAGWRIRLIGIVAGFAAIQAVNILRVITLFYLAAWNHEAFEFAHLYLWQALIMLDVLIVWLIWVRQVARSEASRELALA